MSLYEQVVNTLKSDMDLMVNAISANVVNSKLSHEDYLFSLAKIGGFKFVGQIISDVQAAIAANPDVQLAPSFVQAQPAAPAEPAPDEVAPNSTISVDVDSGAITGSVN